MQKRHDFNVLTMELRLICIKPPKLYVNSSRVWELIGIRWCYKSEAKWGKQDYCLFLGSATLSEVIKQPVVAGCTCGCHKSMTNTNPVSDHEAAIINSSFNEWLLWVIVFTYMIIDIVKYIMTWWTKYAGVVSPLVSLLEIGNQWPFANHRPLPRLSFRLLGQQPAITGRPRDPSFHLIDVSLSYYCWKYSNR